MKRLTSFRLTPYALLLTFFFLLTPPSLVAQWQPDVRLTYNDSFQMLSRLSPSWNIAAGSVGDVHVVWSDQRDGGASYPEAYYKRSSDSGVTWGPDVRLTHGTYGMQSSVAVSGSDVHVITMGGPVGTIQLWYKRSTDRGVTWGPDVRLTNTASFSEEPCIAASGANVHAVWYEMYGYPYPDSSEIYYKRSTDGGATWGTPIHISNSQYWIALDPTVAVSGNTVHLAWHLLIGSGSAQIYYRRSTDGGVTWGSVVRLDNGTSLADGPCIGAAGSSVHVVWEDTRVDPSAIYYKRSTDGGATWGSDTRLTTQGGSRVPNLAVSGTNVHVIWQDQRDGNDEIYYKLSTDGGVTWGSDTRLTNDPNWSAEPSVAVAGTVVHTVWHDDRTAPNVDLEIYYKRNPTGNTGVEEIGQWSTVKGQRYTATPNPFLSYASIPGHEQERFVLYDISGRLAGTYKGDRIGEGLAPGVYFLRPEGQAGKSVRIVKLR